ncbi:hypothetical protein KR222_004210 [Zaprionus bogoriensis]|nr:hypothetical protein KR222_004210 [Zaprionus bogoriensis]
MSLPTKKATTATGTHAVVQAVETYIQNQNLLGEIAELDDLLYDVIDSHKDNALALRRVVQCIYNLLQANNRWNVRFGSKVFHKLISVVIADGDADADGNADVCAEGQHCQLVASVLICIQIYVRKFPRVDSKFLLRQLWSLSLSSERQPYAAQILVKLFDDFARELGEECTCCSELHTLIQNLVQSEQREFRKTGHFLMRKLLEVMQTESQELKHRTLKCSDHQWSAYVAIMESLEEQQSHLVLPTITTLLPHVTAGQPLRQVSEEWLTWLRIMYARLLQDNNIQVLRWTLSYFLSNFDMANLCHAQLLVDFLAATNKSQLYNVESCSLSLSQIDEFMVQSRDESCAFLQALAEVPWQSVPLHFWLSHMQPERDAVIDKNLLLQISSRVRTLRNTKLRKMCNQFVFYLFAATIKGLSLSDYLVFVETLFNLHDNYYDDHQCLINKIEACENFAESASYFSRRCCEITGDSGILNNLALVLIPQLTKLPKSRHGWWRIFLLFRLSRMNAEAKQICLDFYASVYELNMNEMQLYLSDAQQYLIQKLNCQTKEEISFVLEHCVDWYVEKNFHTWSQIEESPIGTLELLERGNKATFMHLAKLLKDVKKPLEVRDKDVIPALVSLLKKYHNSEEAVASIVLYASRNLSFDENNQLIADMLKYRYEWINKTLLFPEVSIGSSLIVQGIIEGDTLTGDARIEAAYIDSLVDHPVEDIMLRNLYILILHFKSNVANEVAAELLRINNQLSDKKPRYFENCKEHRVKIRIVRALQMLHGCIRWSDDMWTALLATCDQPNISYMYECLVARLLPSFKLLFEKLKLLDTLKPSQQLSIISLAHIYCMLNWGILSLEELQQVVGLLLPHTMGANFQTRLLTQLVLHKLALKCEESSIDLPIVNVLKMSIETVLGARLSEFKRETRILLPEIMSQCELPADVILYMTNTPFDEYHKINKRLLLPDFVLKAKKHVVIEDSTPVAPLELLNLNVQRKMNPLIDAYHWDDQPKTQGLIVVASLLDKLPNLGGLARTCEVLGVKTLVLSAKSVTDKTDFTNLSMTAEKSLNIVEVKTNALSEFLIDKQTMGYKVVGAEQTANSTSFKGFKFPEKSILLLGHEKHGIPVDLIALLDYAVEIPQFGLVRSLNVHVTGSLFIWEYCKQHLSTK